MTKKPQHFRDVLTFASRARYAVWRLLGGRTAIDLKLNSGIRLRVRSLATTDYGTAWQIFFRDDYESPVPIENVRQIVDLGANVGYSCLYWCHRYPNSRITTFEPHPAHLQAIQENLELNGWCDRVKVVGAAAGSRERTSYLTDGRSSSTVTEDPAAFQIRVLDIFRELETTGTIDLLKIDIEGSEYEILSDPRFSTLDVRAIVLEWHKTPDHPDALPWCSQKLQNHAYQTYPGVEDPPLAGLVWAFRAAPPQTS